MATDDRPEKLADPVEWAQWFWDRYDLGEGKAAFAAMTSMMRLSRMMGEKVEAALKGVDLNTTDYLLLMTLRLSNDGSRLISHLARNLLVHPTTATLATDRLESRGLLARSPHPTDRRAVLVTITDDGKELVDKATEALRSVDFGYEGATEAQLKRITAVSLDLRTRAGDRKVERG